MEKNKEIEQEKSNDTINQDQGQESTGETRRILEEFNESANKRSRKAGNGLRNYDEDARSIPL